ncbi:hypothetical protein ACJU26_08725 [Acidithiobacillus sp. M4-SHS-6]|uniref:hypothetical protein n=1 Tax=Acidithiobacillus sp. M4-SHS-6 TaxID=3383024 RepID=UPI0039BDF82D
MFYDFDVSIKVLSDRAESWSDSELEEALRLLKEYASEDSFYVPRLAAIREEKVVRSTLRRLPSSR